MNAQANFYSFWIEFIYKHEFQNLAMTLLMNIKENFWIPTRANIHFLARDQWLCYILKGRFPIF